MFSSGSLVFPPFLFLVTGGERRIVGKRDRLMSEMGREVAAQSMSPCLRCPSCDPWSFDVGMSSRARWLSPYLSRPRSLVN